VLTRRQSINRLIELFPDDRDQLVAAADRAARLSHDCGCTQGAIAMTIAIALAAAYYAWPGQRASGAMRISALWALPFVITAAGLGKLIGIGVARLRLALIYRRLYAKYDPRTHHVQLHQMGRPSSHRV
jgi:hypothetical protein